MKGKFMRLVEKRLSVLGYGKINFKNNWKKKISCRNANDTLAKIQSSLLGTSD